uniref:Large ribosomal subunit protein P2 n=1 Tax=Setaria digitata TaxID=48799 RepID=A0A915PKB7_9BILA
MGAKSHHITANDIENILGSVGVDCEHDKAEEVIKKMQGKMLDELISEGSKHLTSVASSSIGSTPSVVASGDTAPSSVGARAVAASSAEKKDEKKEKEEESDEDMGFGLFD